MIFETERLLIRKLNFNDLEGFHLLESDAKVLKYATGNVKNITENEAELKGLISKYTMPNNNFWIYAAEIKKNNCFLGTVALVKDGFDDEIGYRILQKYWGMGYGTELCAGLVNYCKDLNLKKIVGYVVNKNIASVRILRNLNFKKIKTFINEENFVETKYQLEL